MGEWHTLASGLDSTENRIICDALYLVSRRTAFSCYGNHWPTNVPATIGPLAAGASTTFHVAVTVPDDQIGVHTDTATITVADQHDPTQLAQTVVTTLRARFRLFVLLVTAHTPR